MRRLTVLLAAFIAAAGPGAGGAIMAADVTVFAAASLTDAMTEVGRDFEAAEGIEVRFSFASSSTLARQIEAGAPAGVVALASNDWADYLAARGLILSESRVSPIGSSLVVIAPVDSTATLSDPPKAAELTGILGHDGRLALGDPAHVPAGIYAQEAMVNLGLWDALADRLALTDNVRAALALVAHGETPLGVVYATDAAVAPQVRVLATLPNSSHAPITYPFALVAGGDTEEARAFLDFVTGSAGLAIFHRYGFAIAGRVGAGGG